MTIEANDQTSLLIPVNQVSALLGGVSRSSVYLLMDNGDLERVKLGARSFVTRSSVDALVERLREEAIQREQERADRRRLARGQRQQEPDADRTPHTSAGHSSATTRDRGD